MKEGPLSKWTNYMTGWQYRWFVFDEEAGLLVYYTSKDKMVRGQRRGCVRLRGAVVGIENDDDVTFSITSDQKVFHFQARDAEERDCWVRAVENVVHCHSGQPVGMKARLCPASLRQTKLVEFERRMEEADAYLQMIITHTAALEEALQNCTAADTRTSLTAAVESAQAMMDSAKHVIVMLQLAKTQLVSQARPSADSVGPTQATATSPASHSAHSESSLTSAKSAAPLADASLTDSDGETAVDGASRHLHVPIASYSSEEEFFDAFEDSDEIDGTKTQPDESHSPEGSCSGRDSLPNDGATATAADATLVVADETNEPDWGDADADVDAIYNSNDDDDLGDVQEHGSVIMHLLSQLRIGMDLTRITLPTFILERRSLLEMYADFFAHPDLFIQVTDCQTAEERMVAMVRWFLSSFHAARKGGVAKKPYNPLLGETFRCYWDVPTESSSNEAVADGPYPGANTEQLTFVAEQVSHHPPVSAFYAEHVARRIQCSCHIWTQSKFYGLSIGVHNVGEGRVWLLDLGEEYVCNFPSGFGRSILTTPWVELGGKVKISCEKTGYYGTVEFLTKPFYGGKPHCVTAEVFKTGVKTPILSVRGTWNGVMTAKRHGSGLGYEPFLDVNRLDMVPKRCRPVAEQQPYESRRLWRHVTWALKTNNLQVANGAKHWLEQRQRLEAKQRSANGSHWNTKLFGKVADRYVLKQALQQRVSKSSTPL